jgi:hypothetical protein
MCSIRQNKGDVVQWSLSFAAAPHSCKLLLPHCIGLPITNTTMGLSADAVCDVPEVLASPAVRCSASMGTAASMLLLLREVC